VTLHVPVEALNVAPCVGLPLIAGGVTFEIEAARP
jgi:hypothetical protein